ncbi:unnamed protein product [Cylindrotheca closterium]|uniref:Protein xylosyltransferase n=1 Tax=Cylindrotheca closterium TaxID=2856 RepID=A0AAD2FCC4_9STRA|nr:unnamed protein product [Cylindrotheca closterium]
MARTRLLAYLGLCCVVALYFFGNSQKLGGYFETKETQNDISTSASTPGSEKKDDSSQSKGNTRMLNSSSESTNAPSSSPTSSPSMTTPTSSISASPSSSSISASPSSSPHVEQSSNEDFSTSLNSSEYATINASSTSPQHATRIEKANTTTSVSVFYHLYLKDDSEIERVTDIVLDQFQWLKQSIHNTVYVNSVGTPMPLLANLSNVSDVLVQSHQTSGSEFITLNNIWQFCNARPSEKVAYLHSKGSFHATKVNEELRKVLSFAALSKECADLPMTCNVCSLKMSPFPHAHTSGNMWLARFSYINKLLGPDSFLQKMGKRDNQFIGKGRYAAEHWVHSHPQVRPCDLYSKSSFNYGYFRVPSMEELTSNLKLEMAPRFSLGHTLERIVENRFARGQIKHYPSFAQRLNEYTMLYGIEKPDLEWWGWTFFNATSKDNRTIPPHLLSA